MGAPAVRARSVRPDPGRRGAGALALTLVLAVLLGACVRSAAEAPRPLRVVLSDDWADAQVVADAVADFEAEHEGVRVSLHGVPFHQVPTTVAAAADAGEPFDVAQWHAFAAAAQDLARPLDDLWESLQAREFVPGAVDDVRLGDRLFGVPLDTNALVMLTNGPALRERGIDPTGLTSFGRLRRAVDEVVASGRYGVTIPASSWVAFGWIRANGGQLVRIADDGTPTFTLDAPEVVEAIDFLGELIASGGAPSPTARDMANDGLALFQSGRALVHPSGSWDVEVVGAAEGGEDGGVSIEVVSLPRGPRAQDHHTVLGGSSLFVPADSENRELAFQFMTHLIRDDYALRLAREEGRLPVRRRVLQDPLFQDDPHLAPVVAELEHASPMRLIAYPVATNAFRDALESVLARQEDAATAFARAQETVESSTARWPSPAEAGP